LNVDFDYPQLAINAYGRLELDRPIQARVDAVYSAPFGLYAGVDFYVRSGMPTSRLGWFNNSYNINLYLDPRGSDGRTPTDYEMNLSVGYNGVVGPVTITPMLYLLNVLNRQTPVHYNPVFNPNGRFVQGGPFDGQQGVAPAQPLSDDGPVCQHST